jgi:hypothetical protein
VQAGLGDVMAHVETLPGSSHRPLPPVVADQIDRPMDPSLAQMRSVIVPQLTGVRVVDVGKQEALPPRSRQVRRASR